MDLVKDNKAVVDILPFSAGSALLDRAARVYAITWNRDYEDSRQFFLKYAEYPFFYGLIAVVDNRVVGAAFGVQTLPGHWWHDRVARRVGTHHPALQQAWVLVELAVVPGYRNRQTGSLLHDQIMQIQPFPNLLLSTQVANFGARRFYERHAWRTLHPGFAFHPGNPDYVVMHRRVVR